MKRKIIFISMILFSLKVFAQTWEILKPSFSDGDSCRQIARIAFASKNIGWLFTVYQKEIPNGDFYKKIYKTTDGGLSWNVKRSEFNRDFYIPILFSMEPGYFFSFYTKYDHLYSTNILLSVDGGISWDSSTVITNDSQYGFRSVHFFNQQNGIAFTNYRWFTIDGGHTWGKGGDTITIFPPPSDIFFVNDRLGWMISDYNYYATDGGYIANTTDGGKTWNYYDTLYTPIMYGIDFIDTLKGFAVGTNWNFSTGFIYSTIDGGRFWKLDQFVSSKVFWDIGFLDEKYGWITGSGKILRTTDGGKSWETQIEGFYSNLKKLIILKKDKIAYIFGDDFNNSTHTILKADLSNITTEVREGQVNLPVQFYLSQNYPNPFNSQTVIEYSINQPSFVQLKVFNILGKEVRTLVKEYKTPGEYKTIWDGKNNIGEELKSGVYIYQLNTNGIVEMKKLIMLK
jgi:photosystem II stability/assembly factor-like uncharacterized protein